MQKFLITLAVIFGVLGLLIVSCTVQVASGIHHAINEPSTEIAAAVTATREMMHGTSDSVVITTPLIEDTQGDGYHAEIGIGPELAAVLGITLQYQPAQILHSEIKNPDGSTSANYSLKGGGIATNYGADTLAGSHDAPIGRNERSHFSVASSMASGSGIRLTLHYKDKPSGDECLLNGRRVQLVFAATAAR